ncbi:HIT domain-containing protein [Candidatus Woesearchaeota archaeon]|jgi:histidine triad (HIT) family protein|nr:HIT domain-containing protein [Candidatus Woesearchaeota archaeon]
MDNQSSIPECIFCEICKNTIDSHKLYEDEICCAILDINPAVPGQTLIIPKQHIPIIPLAKEEVSSHLFIVAKKISKVLLQTLNASGTNIFIQNGVAAGQTSSHSLINIIPRINEDKLTAFNLEKNEVSEKIQKQIFEMIHPKIQEVLK